jgi:hypothetical protein
MGLLSININQYNKLSLKEVKLPAQKERELKPLNIVEVKRPLTKDQIFYNKLMDEYPIFKDFVDAFDLIIK